MILTASWESRKALAARPELGLLTATYRCIAFVLDKRNTL